MKVIEYLNTNGIDALKEEFAIKVKDYLFCGVLFQAKKNKTKPLTELTKQRDSYRVKLLSHYMEKFNG